jgi:hypothetical protein
MILIGCVGDPAGTEERGGTRMLDEERRWLILASLGSTFAVFLFFLVAPALHYPLEFSESLRIAQIIAPVFMAYLGTAAQFVFAREAQPHSLYPLGFAAKR